MSKVGLISDIHGDLQSLEKAIQLFKQNGVQDILCAGDTVEKGHFEDEVVVMLKQLEIPCAQGNHDENAVRHYDLSLAPVEKSEVRLSQETIEFLRRLPVQFQAKFEKANILVCHAIPSNNGGSVFHADGDNRLSKRFKKDLARTDSQIVVVGHTHSPFDIRYRGKRIINPGASCRLKPKDSHTVGVLELPAIKFRVLGLKDSSEVDIPVFDAH